MRSRPRPYIDALSQELAGIEADFVALLEASEILNVDPNVPGGVLFIGAAQWGWASNEALQARRMDLLGRVRDFRPRFQLMFPNPTPEIRKRHNRAFSQLEKWLEREHGDRSVPSDIPTAVQRLRDVIADLQAARELLPVDPMPWHVVVDTNVLLDNPDLGQFADKVGARYTAHVLPVVLRELDDLKRAGRNEDLRAAAKRADRRLKGLRDNGDVSVGAKVSGDIWAVFEHVDPRADGLPSWLDLDVPDDRFVASTLLLVSRHPRAITVAATGDLNLQTKLDAARLPYLDSD